MSMDGLRLVIGEAPSELSDGKLVAKVYEEMERIQEGLKQPLQVKGQRKGTRSAEQAEKKRKTEEVLRILSAAGMTPQQYIDMIKEEEDG